MEEVAQKREGEDHARAEASGAEGEDREEPQLECQEGSVAPGEGGVPRHPREDRHRAFALEKEQGSWNASCAW
jgi:hypothetical protein